MLKNIAIFIFLISLYSCTNTENFDISPIDPVINKQFLTGQGLDTRLFSTKDIFQYYEIDNYKGFENKELLQKLNAFIQETYPTATTKFPETLTIFFYRKNSFSNYGDGIYEAARDNEFGRIDKEDDNLVALSRISHETGSLKLLRNTIIYNKKKLFLQATDTIATK